VDVLTQNKMTDPIYKPGDIVIYQKKYAYMDVIVFGTYDCNGEWTYAMNKTQSGCQVKESEIIKKI